MRLRRILELATAPQVEPVRRPRYGFSSKEHVVSHALHRPDTSKANDAQRIKRGRVEDASRVAAEKRAALVERLRRKAADADEGMTIDTADLTDDQFIGLIRR